MSRLFFPALIAISLVTAVYALPARASDNQELYNATQQAINAYCTDTAQKPATQSQTSCAEAISTIVKGFATQYAAQFRRGSAINVENENFGAFADYNLKRNCLNDDHSLAASLQCIRSIHSLENDQGHSGHFADGGQEFTYDRSNVKTQFDQPLFELISMGTVCAYGLAYRAVTEQSICRSAAADYGLNFNR